MGEEQTGEEGSEREERGRKGDGPYTILDPPLIW